MRITLEDEIFVEEVFDEMSDNEKKEMAKMLFAEGINPIPSETPEQVADRIKKQFLPHDIDRLIERLKT